MKLWSYNYKGKELEFRMSHKAKCELEEMDEDKLEVFDDPKVFKATSAFSVLKDEDENKKDDEILEGIGTALKKINHAMKEIDPYDFMYVLLHNSPKTSEISKDDWNNEIVPCMEDELGFDKVTEIFVECKDKVFHLLEQLNKKSNEVVPKEKKEKRAKTMS